MNPFVVSARKYRPLRFDDVVGQRHVTTTLKNAIAKEQVAQAMLFCGPQGVGKTTCARIVAYEINGFTRKGIGEAAPLNIFELDAASNNSVEDIRNLSEQVRFPPQQGKYKVYIIDEVHMLSQQAFNAFLKTLEEPPPYAVFILATTQKYKVLPTILSRCQIFDFKRISLADITTHLHTVAQDRDIKTSEEALLPLARRAEGSLRDALSWFDMLASFVPGKEINRDDTLSYLNILSPQSLFALTDHLTQQEQAAALLLLDELVKQGIELRRFVTDLGDHFRHLLLAKHARTLPLLSLDASTQAQYVEKAAALEDAFLLSSIETIHACDQAYAQSHHPRLLVELMLIKMSGTGPSPPTAAPSTASEPKTETKSDTSAETRTETKSETKAETSAETRTTKTWKTPSPSPASKHPPTPKIKMATAAPAPKKQEQVQAQKQEQAQEKKQEQVTPPAPKATTALSRPYADSEAFTLLVQKYPLLARLRDSFGLEARF